MKLRLRRLTRKEKVALEKQGFSKEQIKAIYHLRQNADDYIFFDIKSMKEIAVRR